MDCKSCSVINDNFILTDDGKVFCTRSKKMIADPLERAYIFINFFFWDIIQTELNKLAKKINDRKDAIVASAEIDPNATDKIFPQLSTMFKQETKSNALDGLIKLELGKIRPHISLNLTKAEEQDVEKLHNAIYKTEFDKFRNTVIITEEPQKPKEINFSPEYIAALLPRARRLLGSAIKMTAYIYGMEFEQFDMTPEYKLTYLWSKNTHRFNEDMLKERIKAVIAETSAV
jgi:hypothetical protein